MTTTHPTLGENRLPRNPLVSEVLALASKQKTKAKKIQTLKQYESLHLIFEFLTVTVLFDKTC